MTGGTYRSYSSWRQPVQTLQTASGSLHHTSGFISSILLYPDKDTDLDGLPDELDPDNDNDGIPDALELSGELFFPSTPTDPGKTDTDGDLYSDLEEWVLGSAPNIPEGDALFSNYLSMESNILIEVSTRPGKRYEVFFIDDLAGPTSHWNSFSGQLLGVYTETGAVPASVFFQDAFSEETTGGQPETRHRFYRVTVQHTGE